MSTALTVPGSGAVPAHILAAAKNRQLKGFLKQADVPNKISLKGSRFNQVVGGKIVRTAETTFLDVIIVGATGKVSRMYYGSAYDPGDSKPPVCWSSDGQTPDVQVTEPQCGSCAACPMNVLGSATQGGAKAKACSYMSRIAVVVADDPDLVVYQLDAKGGSLFGGQNPAENKFNYVSYNRALHDKGLPLETVITRMRFDSDSSTPKLHFSVQDFLTEDEMPVIFDIVDGPDVERALVTVIGGQESTSPGQVALPGAGKVEVPVKAAPAPAPAPEPAPARKAVTRKAAAPAPAPAPEPEPEPQPAGRRSIGRAAPATPAPQPAPRQAPQVHDNGDDDGEGDDMDDGLASVLSTIKARS